MNKKNNLEIAAIYSASFFSFVYYMPNILLASFYIWYKNIPREMVILLVTLPTLVMAGYSLLLSRLMPRLSKKKVLMTACGLIIAAGILVLGTGGRSFVAALAAAILQGIGFTTVQSTCNIVLMRIYPEHQSEAVARNEAIGAAGGIVIMQAAGHLAAAGSWMNAFLLNLLSFVPLIAVAVFLHDDQPENAVSEEKNADTLAGAEMIKVERRGIQRYLSVAFPYVLCFLGNACWNQNNSVWVMIDTGIGSTIETGNMSTLGSVAAFISGMFLIRRFLRRFGKYTAFAACIGIAACFSVIGLAATKSMMLLYLSSFFFMIFWEPLQAVVIPAYTRGIHRDIAVPLTAALTGMATFAAPHIYGFLAGFLGGGTVANIRVGMWMYIAAGLMYLFVMRRTEGWPGAVGRQ